MLRRAPWSMILLTACAAPAERRDADPALLDPAPPSTPLLEQPDPEHDRRYAATMAAVAEQKIAAGDFAGALPMLDDALARDPTLGRAWLSSARAAEGIGASPDVVATRYQRALTLLPDDAAAWHAAGLAAEGHGDHALARTRYERAVLLAPKDDDALTRLASLELAAGEPAAAATHFAAAVKIDGASVPALFGLAEAAEHAGDLKTAEAALKELARRNPDVAIYKQRLVAFYKRIGRAADAKKIEKQLSKQDPKDDRRLRSLKPTKKR